MARIRAVSLPIDGYFYMEETNHEWSTNYRTYRIDLPFRQSGGTQRVSGHA